MRIIELRKERNLSQKQLANLLNTSQSCISRIENDKCEISPFILQDMSNLFNVSIDYLLGKSSDPGILIFNEGDSLFRDINDYETLISRYRSLSDEHKAAVKINVDFYYKLENHII
jgi:transcriptional regulator with XRE-family HTH domain